MKRFKLRTLEELRPLVRSGKYRLGAHATQHAKCEGFTEKDVVNTILYGRELLRYHEDERLLILGYIRPRPDVNIPLHVVIEYSVPRRVDVVTAFIPKDAYRVISRTRLAEILRYDRHRAESRWLRGAASS